MQDQPNHPTTTLPDSATVTLPQLWDQKQLCAYVKKSEAWAERARWAGEGPKYIKLGRHVRYRVSDVLEWLNQCEGV
ncbi:helix-turn-helix transcriptional regulator [Desulfurivibrio alkaliphilus]|uniref:Helix-turn-helix domain-containing protein n=1 Tax=Desulfurivibrio alkaliphilus (strain DSM 19089 / UNIQEM U267 / AHT2) TaxID=589865 RepID=D6Z328_DESAT|nr:helix-turn-helix domain-containing protein [Desulfurivibrio alkaliphilus]ADH85953.1 hypothetical protein DaAHT2_1257 [Desulfurivibrio alkaliphilus AHT 2]